MIRWFSYHLGSKLNSSAIGQGFSGFSSNNIHSNTGATVRNLYIIKYQWHYSGLNAKLISLTRIGVERNMRLNAVGLLK